MKTKPQTQLYLCPSCCLGHDGRFLIAMPDDHAAPVGERLYPVCSNSTEEFLPIEDRCISPRETRNAAVFGAMWFGVLALIAGFAALAIRVWAIL
jgi:hypothetical protein